MFDSYHFWLITLATVGAYAATYLLAKANLIKEQIHRMTWNFALLATFLTSGILGLILAFLVDQKISISWYQNFLWLHVEFGIVMALISIFHITWHLKYYFNVFKSSPINQSDNS